MQITLENEILWFTQKNIVDILSAVDEKLEVLCTQKEKYKTLKQGLMQKLLSEEVGV